MITFTDGTEISWEEAAGLIEAEGALITTLWYDSDGQRCVVGVLENWTKNGSYKTDRNMKGGNGLMSANDLFLGTPEARAVYMAAWCRAQDEEKVS